MLIYLTALTIRNALDALAVRAAPADNVHARPEEAVGSAACGVALLNARKPSMAKFVTHREH